MILTIRKTCYNCAHFPDMKWASGNCNKSGIYIDNSIIYTCKSFKYRPISISCPICENDKIKNRFELLIL